MTGWWVRALFGIALLALVLVLAFCTFMWTFLFVFSLLGLGA